MSDKAKHVLRILQGYLAGYEVYEGDSEQTLKKCSEEPKWNFEDRFYALGFSKQSLSKRIDRAYDERDAVLGSRNPNRRLK